jgi:hypothetical protein
MQLQEFDALAALSTAVEQGAAKVLVIPFQLNGSAKDTARAVIYANIAQLGFIPVLPLSFAHGTTTKPREERIAVLASPVAALQALQANYEVLCFPVAQFLRENDGTGKIVSNDGLACLVAAGMASFATFECTRAHQQRNYQGHTRITV